MVGKNNNYVRESKSNEHFQRFALRKLSVGVVSVAVAAGFYLGSGATAQAATTESNASAKTEQVVQQNSTSAASDSTSTSNSSAAVSTSSATPVSTESASSMTVSDLPASASAASDNQASAANASESSSQSASSSVASDAAATVSKDSQAASEANSQSAADVETVQLPTSAANANANESQAANILGAQAVQKAANQQAPAGFTVTDPNYPAEMYKDPDASHYTYWWAQSSNGEYNLVLSTDRNGDGKVYVFLLGNNNNVLGKYTVDKNKSTEVATDDEGDFGTVYNDGQSGVFVTSDGTWKSKFNVFDPKVGEDDGDYGSISFMIPQVETQTTTYVTYFDSKGNKVDKPIEVSDPVIQKGLDGQIYTTKGGKVINGYFAKEPKNAHGFMSPFGKQGAIYTKDWHDGLKATFTETDTKTGLMHVVVKHYYHTWGWGTWRTVKEFDLAPGQSEKVDYDVYKSVTIHSIYIPQTINIQYTYEKLGNLVISSDSKSFPAEDKTQYPNDKSDSTKAGNVTIPKVAGFTPTINDKTVTNYTFNPSDYVSDLSKDINVVYVADTQEATINFYDETDQKLLDNQTIHLTGKTGEKVDRTQADQTSADLVKQGYVLDKEDTAKAFPADAVYDNNDQTPQEFTIYLKHDTTHTDATSSKADQKTVSETIHYVYKDGVNANKPAADDANTTVTFKRGYTTDKVTGKIVSYDPWTVDGKQADSKTFDAVKSPVIAGYTADQAEVAAQTVKPDSQNINKTVYYTADTQEATINFYDETDQKLLDNQTIHLTGKTGEKVDRTQADQTSADLVKQGYVLDKEDTAKAFPADAVYDNNDQTPQEFTIYLKHDTTHTDATSSKADQKTVSETIHYVYKDGVNANKPAADDANTTVTFKRGYTTDKVTGKIVSYDPWTVDGKQADSKTFDAVKSPVIAGYTADQAEVAAQTVKPDSQNINKTVYYTADTQEATINFYDETDQKLLDNQTIHLTGKTGEKVDRTQADQTSADLVKQGYVLDKEDTAKAFPADAVYDNNDQTPQEFTIYLKHDTTHTDATSSKADQKTVSETIHYVYKDGVNANKPAADDANTTVTFKRGYTTDKVTGKIVSYDPWTVDGKQADSKTFDAVKSPVIAGYTADQAEVAAQTVTPDSQNINKTVYYTADTQEAAINFYDETDHKLLNDQTIHLTGKTGEKVDRTQADQTSADLVKQGYVLDKEDTAKAFPADAVYDNNDQTPQEFTIYLKHDTTHTDATSSKADQKTVSETIHYVYKDGVNANKPAADDANTTVTFKRGYTTDKVTGKIVSYDPWTVDGKQADSKTFDAVKSPVIAGYTADQAEVAAQTVTPDSQNINKTVYYTADTQEAAINFYDETDHKLLNDQTIHLTGKTGEKVDRTQADQTSADLVKQGYVLDKEDTAKAFPADAVYDNNDQTPQEFTIYLKHDTTHTDATSSKADQKTVSETIHYVYKDGVNANKPAADDANTTVTFKRGYTTDKVTGKIVSYDPWTVDGKQADSKTFDAVKSPVIAGYTADQAEVAAQTVTPDSQNINKTVYYTADTQEATINFYDETDQKLLDNQTIHLTGKTGEKVDRTQADQTSADLVKQGYVLDKEDTAKAFPADAVYDNNDQTPQEFTIYLKHDTTHTDATSSKADQKTVSETIHYVYKDGVNANKPAADDANTTVTFKRGYTTDKVTGKIVSYDPWTVDGKQADSKTFDAVKSPVIAGYTADQAEVAAQTVKPDSQNINKTVYYTADTQEATINFYDETDQKLLDNQTIHLTGKTGEKVDRTQADQTSADLVKQGYVLDKEDTAKAFPADAVYDNNDQTPQEFTIYLKHDTTHTDATSSKADQKTVSETIHYVYKDGVNANKPAADDANTTVTFKRGYTTDKVTGKIVSYDPWTVDGKQADSKTFDAVKSPVIAGYTADQAEVAAQTVKPDSQNINKTVYYTADTQEATINFYDETDQKLLDNQTIHLTGKTGEKVDRTQADQTSADLVKQGYVLDKEDTAKAFPADAVYDNNDQTPQEFTIYLKHDTTHTDATSSKADQKTVSETIHYVYKDGVNANKPAADDANTTVTFKRGYTTDKVTGKIVSYDPWTVDGKQADSKTFDAVKSPVIAGYTADQAEVAAQTVKPDSQNINKTVYYTADTQEAAINFYDETDHKLLNDQTIHLTGKTGEKVDRTQADQTSADLVKQGYVLDKEDTAKAFPADAVYDNNDQTPQEFTIYLKHDTTHTDATSSKADQKTVSETIHYVYKDGVNANKPAADDANTTVTFKRGYTTDKVTGKIVSYDPWTVDGKQADSKTFDAVKSPVIAGYTADQAEVAAQTVTPDSQNINKTVYYTADTQEAAINFYDETDHKLLNDQTIHLTGKTGEKVDRTQADQTSADLVKQGYVLDKEDTAKAFPADAVYDNNDQTPQEFTIYLKHDTTHTDATSSKADQKTVSETIHYVYKDGVNANKPAADDANTTVTFKRGYTTDKVTGKIVSYDPWTVDGKQADSKTFDAVKSPVIAGYTADQAEVAAQTVKPDSQNINKTVYYTADTQEAAINFYDETDHKLLNDQTIHLTGKTGEKISYTEANQTLAKLVKQGYVLDEDKTKLGFPSNAAYDDDDVKPQEFTIYLKHGMTHTDATDKNAEQKIVTETIHYVYENNQTAKTDYTSAVDFKRGYTTDNVTGKVVSYDPWTVSSKKFGFVKSPIIEGYAPNHSQIDEITVTPDSKDIVKTVVYVGDPQEAQAIFYDETTGKEISNTREIVNGKTDETIGFTKDPNEVVKELEKQGYVFDKDNANNNVFAAGTTYDKNSEVHQYFKYYFTHATTIVTPDNPKTPADVLPDNPGKNYPSGVAKDDLNKTVTRTINITTPDGKTQTITQKAEFTRSATVDEVTGEVTYGPWSKNVVLESVDVPNISGYVPSASVPEITVTPNDQDMTINITYKKLDSGKAADQGGNASNGGQATNGGSTTGQSAQNGQSGQTQNNAGAQQLPQTGNANNEKGALGLASAMFAAGLGLGFGSKKKCHED